MGSGMEVVQNVESPTNNFGVFRDGNYCLEGPELSLTLRQEDGLHDLFVVKAKVIT